MKLVLDQMKGTRLALYSKKCYSFQLSVNIISLKGAAIKEGRKSANLTDIDQADVCWRFSWLGKLLHVFYQNFDRSR